MLRYKGGYWDECMNQYLVAVVNGTKARFLTLSSAEFNEYEPGPNLIEHEALVSAENEMQGQELWANTKTGRNRGTSGQAHSYDDHRNKHMFEFERRFAQTIVQRIIDLSQAHQTKHLILVAEPQILGILREAKTAGLSKQLVVTEVAKDLFRMGIKDLHDYLAKRSLLPGFHRVAVRNNLKR